MANNYFQFKEFIVQQEACAMKVTTDACLFGGWTAKILSEQNPASVLDIGTGTGLLSLMLAQQSKATIQAVEIDHNAANQAKENFLASPWKDRLKVVYSAIQDFKPTEQLDCIVTNPPFFENDLNSPDSKRNMALHSTKLDLETLVSCINSLLSAEGCFSILLPYHRTESFVLLAQEFSLIKKVLVKQTAQHNYFRSMLLFSRKKNEKVITEEIIIKDDNQAYSAAFQQLLSQYYLYL